MNKFKLYLLISVVLAFILQGCGKITTALNDDYIDKEDKGELSGTLTISTVFWPSYLENMRVMFEAENPNVKVEVNVIISEEDLRNSFDISEATKKLVVEIMSGNVSDLYEVHVISPYKYASEGVFEDLNKYIIEDDGFDTNDYYMNILKNCEKDGGLYWMPQVFTNIYVRLNNNLMKAMNEEIPNNLSYIDIERLYLQAKEKGLLSDDFVVDQSGHLLENLNQYEERKYIDLTRKEANFMSEEFINYLAFTNKIPFNDYADEKIRWLIDKSEFDGNDYLLSCYTNNFDDINLFSIQEDTGASKPIPLYSSDGKNVFKIMGLGFAIPTASTNKRLAWEFIKFLIKEKEYEFVDETSANYYTNYPYFYEMPLNKKNFYRLAGFYMEGNEEIIEYFTQINESFDAMSFYDANIENLLEEVFSLYQRERVITADEAAKMIQDKFELYLYE